MICLNCSFGCTYLCQDVDYLVTVILTNMIFFLYSLQVCGLPGYTTASTLAVSEVCELWQNHQKVDHVLRNNMSERKDVMFRYRSMVSWDTPLPQPLGQIKVSIASC